MDDTITKRMGTMPSKTPYEILAVPQNIGYVALRGHYRHIIHEYKQNKISDKEFRFKIRAYETLSDYEKRTKYDSTKEWISDLQIGQYTIQQLAAESVLISVLKYRLHNAHLTEIDAPDPITFQTILYVAARAGNLTAVEYLTQQGANPDLLQRTKSTALHVASFYGHADIVRCLLESGASYHILNADQRTAEQEAGTNDVNNIFIELKQNPYVRTAANDIEWFSNNNFTQHIDEEYFAQRQTLLHCASKKGYDYLVRFFVEIFEANLNIVDINGNSALHLAARYGHVTIVDYLVNQGCNSTLYNRWSLTAEQEGSKHGDKIMNIFQSIRSRDMFEMVRQGIVWWFEYYFNSASPDSTDSEGVSLLHHACFHGQYNIVKWLLEHKANVNIQTRETPKNTPLHEAIRHGHLKIVELLLEYDVDTTIKNDLNSTVYEQGFSKQIDRDIAKQIYQLLLKHRKNFENYKLIDVHIYREEEEEEEDSNDEPTFKIQLHHAATYNDLLYSLPSHYRQIENLYFSIARRRLIFETKETTLLSAVCRARYLESKLIDTPICLTLHKKSLHEKSYNQYCRSDPQFDFYLFAKFLQTQGTVTHFQLKPSIENQTINIDNLTFTFSGGSINDDLEFEVRTLFSPAEDISDLSGCICLFETCLYEDTPKLLKLPHVSIANDPYARLYTLAISTPYWFSCNTRRTRLPMLHGIHAFIRHDHAIPMILTLHVDMIIAASINQPLVSREQPVKCHCLSLREHDPIHFPDIGYHGTNISFVRSILVDGLVLPKTITNHGKRVTRRENHLRRDREAFKIVDYVDAIFLTPSVHYSCDRTYAVPFRYRNQQLLPVLECSVKKDSYSCFPCTVPTYTPHADDNIQAIEWRILDPENIVINAILFIPMIKSFIETEEQ